MEMITTYSEETLSMNERLSDLRNKGYILKFRREDTCLYCYEWHQWIWPEDFEVDGSYYFENIQNPDEDRILYAISSQGAKGFLIDECNVYTDNISPEMILKLK